MSSFVFYEVTDIDIFDALKSFTKHNSFDYDGISVKYLKLIASNNIDFFVNFINSSFLTCDFPTSLKRATVSPIYKSGDKNNLLNYRPISILPSLSKLIEKIIVKKMYKFLSHTNFFASNQYGFIPGRSTEMVLLEFSKFILNSVDNSKITVAIFLDIKKAFDNVNHSLLIYKLEKVGFRGNILNWFISYLSGRTQRVKVGNDFSEYSATNRGVPQGSILGPLFFLIFINDFCKLNLSGKILTYADDSVLLYSCSNSNELVTQIESDLIEIDKWFNANDLTLNLNKTKYINFSLRHSELNLNLRYHNLACITKNNCLCHILECVQSYKYLGLNFDSNLKWKTHIFELGKKLRFILFNFYHLKNKIDVPFLKTLYFSWFYSLVNYGVTIWGGEYRSNLQPLISIQNKIFKILNQQSYPNNFRLLKLLPLRHNAFFRIILYLYRNKYLFNTRERPYNTRSISTYRIPKFSKSIFCKHFFYLAPKLYNNLPLDLTSINKYSVFKRNLFDLLINIDDLDLYFSLQ